MNRELAEGRNRRQPAVEIEQTDIDAPGRRRQPAHAKVKQGGWFRRHKIVTVFLSLVLVAAAVIGGLLLRVSSDPASLLVNRGGSQPGGAAPNGGNAEHAGYDFPKDIVNILVLGTDANAERVKQGMNARTDCIMLVSINTSKKTVALISIPRDTYVPIYDENNKEVARNRINAAFAFGGGLKKDGAAYAENTVIQCFGGSIPIDHFVLFDMDLVKNLIDDVGGVTVNVDISVTVKSVGVSLKPGKQKLNGIQALTYARDRHNTKGGDFGRVGHQQQVMIALLKELQNKGNIVKRIPELYQSLSGSLAMDSEMGAMQIAALAWIAKDVDPDGVKQYTLSGKSVSINGASMVVSDQEKKQQILKEVFGIDYQIRNDQSYDNVKNEISDKLKEGKGIVNKAKSLLSNNKRYYTADDAEALRNAIADWQAAYNKNDVDAAQEALDDVQTEYDILLAIIDQNKTAPAATPTPEATREPENTLPPEDTLAPDDTPGIEPRDTVEPAPTEEPVITEAPAATDGEQEPPA